jgi:hypothetical protein
MFLSRAANLGVRSGPPRCMELLPRDVVTPGAIDPRAVLVAQ